MNTCYPDIQAMFPLDVKTGELELAQPALVLAPAMHLRTVLHALPKSSPTRKLSEKRRLHLGRVKMVDGTNFVIDLEFLGSCLAKVEMRATKRSASLRKEVHDEWLEKLLGRPQPNYVLPWGSVRSNTTE